MASQLATKPGLAAEGHRVGADFRLGACTGAWTGRRYSGRLAAGALLLIVLVSGVFIPPLATVGTARALTGGLDAFILAWAILLIVLPPRSWKDRLFIFQAGIVLLDLRDPEPRVARWAQLDTLTVTLDSSYEDYFIDTCVLRGRDGTALTVPRHLKAAFADVVAAAERVLAPRLVPALIARLDSGKPVIIGDVTAGRHGLSVGAPSGRAPDWRASWTEIRSVEFTLEGQHVTVKAGWRARDSRRLDVGGKPNSFLLRYLVAHVAAEVGFPVEGRAPGWDGRSGYDPDATLVAPTLPAPGTGPEPEPERARKRHPARTAFLAALVAGILAAAALTFYHGGAIMPPCTSNCDSGDHIASLWHASAPFP